MNAVCLVRTRQLANRMKFFAAIVGYNPRIRFANQIIYLIYVALFFSIWGFAMLALLADFGAKVLLLFTETSASRIAVLLITILLLADAILRGFIAGNQSPFTFSEEDAALICQSPVNRRHVAIAWMVGDWIPAVLPYLAVAVVLRFASIQIGEPAGIQWNRLPFYWIAGLRVVSVMAPLHLAFSGAVFTFGALRLRDGLETSHLRLIPIGLGFIIIMLVLGSSSGWQTLFWPVLFSLKGGFGEANWIAGLLVAFILAISGLLLLCLASPRLNLSRAAQESHRRWAHQNAMWLGDSHIIQQLKLRERLGAGHAPNRLPGMRHEWALTWKEWLVSLRTISLAQIGAWVCVFTSGLGWMLAPDWGMRTWALIIWIIFLGQQCTRGLRSDLEMWAISRSLPHSPHKVFIAEVASPVVTAILINFIAFSISIGLPGSTYFSFAILIPAMSICVVFAVIVDILRQSDGSRLLAGQAAELSLVGVVLGLLFTGMPLFFVLWVSRQVTAEWVEWLSALFAMLLILLSAYGLWRLASKLYRNLK